MRLEVEKAVTATEREKSGIDAARWAEGSERFVEEEIAHQILECWVSNGSLVHDGFRELDTQWTEH